MADGGKKKKKPYPFWLGGAAASWAAVCTHPLDLAKVRLQTSKSKSMFGVLKTSVAKSGIVEGAYAGLSASILRQMTYSLVRFGVYDSIKNEIANRHPGKKVSVSEMALAASVAGGMGGLAGNPADVVLVRMTGDAIKDPSKRYGYRNCFDGVIRIVREEGPAALFRGLGPNVARAILMNASQLATYDVFKHHLIAMGANDTLGTHFASSFLAGTVATTICAPFDVIKSRIMSASSKKALVPYVARTIQNEGFSWMFKGWTPAWIRLSPNTVIVFMTLEQLKRAVDAIRSLA